MQCDLQRYVVSFVWSSGWRPFRAHWEPFDPGAPPTLCTRAPKSSPQLPRPHHEQRSGHLLLPGSAARALMKASSDRLELCEAAFCRSFFLSTYHQISKTGLGMYDAFFPLILAFPSRPGSTAMSNTNRSLVSARTSCTVASSARCFPPRPALRRGWIPKIRP